MCSNTRLAHEPHRRSQHTLPPRRQLTRPHTPAHRNNGAHTSNTSGYNTKQPLHHLPTHHSQQRTDPGGGKIKAGQEGPSNTGTGRGKQEEVGPKKESWADKMERVEEHLTRGNRSTERTGEERLTTRETHFGDMESTNAGTRRMQIKKHPQSNARQAGKGRHAQILDRTTWTQPRHTRHGNMYQNPQNNNSKYPQHPHHNTWRKRNPEHKSSPNHIRDPKGPPRKPLADWNDAQPEEIGLSNLTLGPAYKARHPKQPHPGRDMRYAGWLGSAGHQATTHRAYDRHASLPTRDAPRPRTRAPNHTAYGQTMRGLRPSPWWNTN